MKSVADVVHGSVFAERVSKTGRFFAFDLDKSLASGDQPPRPGEVRARSALREFAQAHGGEAFLTMRPPEEILGSEAFASARELGLRREPAWPDVTPVDRDMLEDAALSVSIGEPPIWAHPDRTFRPDHRYSIVAGSPWRTDMMDLFLRIDTPDGLIHSALASVEFEQNFRSKESNVLPITGRFNFRFGAGKEGLRRMECVLDLIRKGLRENWTLKRRARFVDESDPPYQYSGYYMHRSATKQASLERVIMQAIAAADMNPEQVEGVYVGDSLTDLWAGLLACRKVGRVPFVIPQEARTAPYLYGETKGPFATTGLDSVLHRLDDTEELGIYMFRPPHGYPRPVILCDLASLGSNSQAESVHEALLWIEGHKDTLFER